MFTHVKYGSFFQIIRNLSKKPLKNNTVTVRLCSSSEKRDFEESGVKSKFDNVFDDQYFDSFEEDKYSAGPPNDSHNQNYNDDGFDNKSYGHDNMFNDKSYRHNLHSNRDFKSRLEKFNMPTKFDMPTLTKIDWTSEQAIKKKNSYVEDEGLGSISEDEIQKYRIQHNLVTSKNAPRPIMSFDHCSFPESIMLSLKEQNFAEPMPVQAQSWPIALNGIDLVGVGQTGSGKTLGFIIPALIHIMNNRSEDYTGPNAVVLAPTRELAQQIYEVAKTAAKYTDINIACVFGGRSRYNDVSNMRDEPSLIIGTPGRFNDLITDRTIPMNSCSYFVLDEADRMLDMGFEPQIRRIADQIRPDRQTLMWSATWPKEIKSLASEFMDKEAVLITVGSTELKANENITQEFVVCKNSEKFEKLQEVVEQMKSRKILIFCQTKKCVKMLDRRLRYKQINCGCLHGDLSQGARDSEMKRFKHGTTKVMIATDVASRGIDVKDIELVINFDFPNNIESYIHRIGRTARGHNKGRSLSLVTPKDENMLKPLKKLLHSQNIDIPENLNSKKLSELEEFDTDYNGGFRDRRSQSYDRHDRRSYDRHDRRSHSYDRRDNNRYGERRSQSFITDEDDGNQSFDRYRGDRGNQSHSYDRRDNNRYGERRSQSFITDEDDGNQSFDRYRGDRGNQSYHRYRGDGSYDGFRVDRNRRSYNNRFDDRKKFTIPDDFFD